MMLDRAMLMRLLCVALVAALMLPLEASATRKPSSDAWMPVAMGCPIVHFRLTMDSL